MKFDGADLECPVEESTDLGDLIWNRLRRFAAVSPRYQTWIYPSYLRGRYVGSAMDKFFQRYRIPRVVLSEAVTEGSWYLRKHRGRLRPG